MTAQMRNFLDQTGSLWMSGALVGKVGSVFTSTGTGGGNESTIISFVTTLMHHGMVYVGLPYACPELADISEVKGGSPWGAACIAGPDGSRQPSRQGTRHGALPRRPRRRHRDETEPLITDHVSEDPRSSLPARCSGSGGAAGLLPGEL